MPFKSEAQRKYMYAKHPEIAKRWTQEEKGKPVKRDIKAAAKKAAAKKVASKVEKRYDTKGRAMSAAKKAVAKRKGK